MYLNYLKSYDLIPINKYFSKFDLPGDLFIKIQNFLVKFDKSSGKLIADSIIPNSTIRRHKNSVIIEKGKNIVYILEIFSDKYIDSTLNYKDFIVRNINRKRKLVLIELSNKHNVNEIISSLKEMKYETRK